MEQIVRGKVPSYVTLIMAEDDKTLITAIDKSKSKMNDQLQVFVSGFPVHWGEKELAHNFKCNVTDNIQSCVIYRDDRGKSRQMGHVRFHETGMVERALERMDKRCLVEDIYDASTLNMSRRYYTMVVQRDRKA